MAITASMVKELRDKTAVGMMDAKKALVENDGDMEAAIDWLRTKGIAKAAKKADRVAAEGLVGVATSGTKAAVVEVNSETDFVARNEAFQNIVGSIAGVALATGADVDAIKAADFPGTGRSVEAELTEAIATIGENMSVRRAAVLEVSNGAVATYIHNAATDGMGKIGVLVALESSADADALAAFGRQIAMHVAAVNPAAATEDEVDPALLEKERSVYSEQAKESGKPENIIEKMVEGRIRKYLEEIVLVKQTFVIDGENTVAAAIEAKGKELGADITLKGFIRFELGDGIEKAEEDFAAEVAALQG